MQGYTARSYGEAIADLYDERTTIGPADAAATAATVEFLAALAPAGRLLELGIGTGRLALPLAARGLAVHGVDVSEPMVRQLRAKPGGADLPVVIGDMADVPVPGPFDLVFIAANTFFALPDQEEQVRCMGNVAARLRPGGAFVVEGFVPDPGRYDRGQTVRATRLDVDAVELETTRHDPVAQTVTAHQVLIGAGGIRLVPTRLRYAWPAELDLMARLAGLRREHRYGGWAGEPFTAVSTRHVSVYRRAG
jgi:SAM-dependent methyltransferase